MNGLKSEVDKERLIFVTIGISDIRYLEGIMDSCGN